MKAAEAPKYIVKAAQAPKKEKKEPIPLVYRVKQQAIIVAAEEKQLENLDEGNKSIDKEE